jgi:hypothetical protein
VVTYNYDDLLEWILGRHPHQSVWTQQSLWKAVRSKSPRLPIYHVHGFVPLQGGTGSVLDEIVLTEDQYHRAAQNPYSWNNLVQMRTLSDFVGLMIGLSLTDRNLRRILDNLRAMPARNKSYALMKKPDPWKVEAADLTSILETMKERVRTGVEPFWSEKDIAKLDGPAIHEPIIRMIRDVQTLDWRREEATLEELGVTVIWYEEHDEIARVIQTIISQHQGTK